MTKSDDNLQKREPTNKKNTKKNLPWWVELLFVQLGLPEKLLRSILTYKTNTKTHIENNNRNYLTLIFLVALVVYINPVITSYKSNNYCIEEVKKLLSKTTNDNKIGSISPTILAVNHCKGGTNLEI